MDRQGVCFGCGMAALSTAIGVGATVAVSPPQGGVPLWFWVGVLVIGGVGVLLLAACWTMGIEKSRTASAEKRFHESPALALTFDGVGTPCVYEFLTNVELIPLGTTHIHIADPKMPIVASTSGYPGVEHATDIRLRVTNLRKRRLHRVRVSVEVLTAEGETFDFPEDWLHWMYDDTPAHQASVEGKEIDPGASKYVDLVMLLDGLAEMTVYFAQDGLRRTLLHHGFYQMRVTASGYDEGTDKYAPPASQTFLVGVDTKRRLMVDGNPVAPSAQPQLTQSRQILTAPSTAPMLPATRSQPSTPHTEEAPRQ